MCDDSEPIQLNLFDMMPSGNSVPNTIGTKTAIPVASSPNHSTLLNKKEKQEKLDKALDKIKNKYGKDAIIRGSLLKK